MFTALTIHLFYVEKMFRRVFTRFAARFLAETFFMLISFIFSYSESVFRRVLPIFLFRSGTGPQRTRHPPGFLLIQEIISNVVAFLTKAAHTLEVLHMVHPSALLMMHTCHKLWGVSSKKRSVTGNT